MSDPPGLLLSTAGKEVWREDIGLAFEYGHESLAGKPPHRCGALQIPNPAGTDLPHGVGSDPNDAKLAPLGERLSRVSG